MTGTGGHVISTDGSSSSAVQASEKSLHPEESAAKMIPQLDPSDSLHPSEKLSLQEAYDLALRQETEEYESVNRDLEQATRAVEARIAQEASAEHHIPQGFEECARLEARLALLEVELIDVQSEPIPNAESEPTFGVSELTSMEVAYSQVENTVGQLRAAEQAERERLAHERDKLEHEKMLLGEAETLNQALSARAVENLPNASLLLRRTQARMSHLHNQFRILQRGLVDFIDHLAISLSQVADNSKVSHVFNDDQVPSLQAYFGRPARYGGDTPQSRAMELKTAIEALMNELLLSTASPRQRVPAAFPIDDRNSSKSDEIVQAHAGSDYVCRVLERIGLVEKRNGRWALVIMGEV